MRYLSTSQLPALLPTPESVLPDDVLLLKMEVLADVQPLSDTRQVRFVISTGAVDRDRDVISQSGWQLDNYRKNPVVLWAHASYEPPIAKAVELGILGDQLTAVAEFASADVYPFADTVYQLVSGGFLRATSVGFRPQEMSYDSDRGGYNFLRCELLEFSVCCVPANPACLLDAKAKGIELAPLKTWAERILDELGDEPGLWLPKSHVAQVFAALSTTSISLSLPAVPPSPSPASVSAPAAASVPPLADAAPALAHLEHLYRQLGHTPPWQAQPDVWEQYTLLCRAVVDAQGDPALQAAAVDQRAALAAQLCPARHADQAADADADALTLDLDDTDTADDEGSLTLDLADLHDGIRAAFGQALMAVTGRLPV